MAEQRELILKLGQKITDRIGHTVTVDDPEYWGLAGVVTDEMAEVALSMKVSLFSLETKSLSGAGTLPASMDEAKIDNCTLIFLRVG